MLKEDVARNSIKHYQVSSQSESVKKFYGGECVKISITDDKNIDEVINALKLPLSNTNRPAPESGTN
jgi:hypothetical protein|tara:strand:- start:102 stop:302 length:201 start_codon:yes stop_codon:yes gene_type:complete